MLMTRVIIQSPRFDRVTGHQCALNEGRRRCSERWVRCICQRSMRCWKRLQSDKYFYAHHLKTVELFCKPCSCTRHPHCWIPSTQHLTADARCASASRGLYNAHRRIHHLPTVDARRGARFAMPNSRQRLLTVDFRMDLGSHHCGSACQSRRRPFPKASTKVRVLTLDSSSEAQSPVAC